LPPTDCRACLGRRKREGGVAAAALGRELRRGRGGVAEKSRAVWSL
jgi:hypothetical protein